jgi:hypothetical protein
MPVIPGLCGLRQEDYEFSVTQRNHVSKRKKKIKKFKKRN